MASNTSSSKWIWIAVVILIIAHQDNWLWENDTLVLGFIPIGLFFHACISVAASLTWFFATRFAWPSDVDDTTPANVNAEVEGAAE